MKHYNMNELEGFVLGFLDENNKCEMEDHLSCCNECMSLYIEIIEKSETADFENNISKDITENIMRQIDKIDLGRKRKSTNNHRIFLYYIAAACITLFLMGSGTFNLLLKTIPNTTAALVSSPLKIESSIGKIKYNNNKVINLLKMKI